MIFIVDLNQWFKSCQPCSYMLDFNQLRRLV